MFWGVLVSSASAGQRGLSVSVISQLKAQWHEDAKDSEAVPEDIAVTLP
jgi:hypothetical protein